MYLYLKKRGASMNAKKEYYEKLLLEKRREVVDTIEILREKTLEDSPKPNNSFAFHMADQGTDSSLNEMNNFFLSRQLEHLSRIDKSLEEIKLGEIGKYGICRACGKEIDEKRLEAVPTTKICVSCKKAQNPPK